MRKLSMEEKIGQLVMVGMEGTSMDSGTQRLVTDYHVGGFIFFDRNINTLQQTVELINNLKEVNVGQVPLFFSVDEEGGRVSRLPDLFSTLPENWDIGVLADEVLAYQFGQILAQRVKGLGLNVNYAPVLDINSNPDNPVIGTRSFGTEPDLVSRLGIETIKGIQDQGIISVIKHFPGHGDTAVDSHVGLPQVETDLERLRTFELVPFQQAIKNGADMVMTAHILLPKLDAQHPATLSRRIMTGLLREELQFDGVIITDDLCMAAIKDNYDLGEAAVQAINAGVDIVMVCHEYNNYITVIKALREAAYEGRIAAARIDQAVSNILMLKERYCLQNSSVVAGDIEATNKATATLLERV